MIFSPIMLNTFQECPEKYYFRYVKNIQAPVLDSHFMVGKNIHAVAAYYLKGEDISIFDLSEKEQTMWNTLLRTEYFSYKPEMIESSVACKIGNYWIGGRLDALVKNDKNYYILDYKTGEIPQNAENNFQTIVYLLCCDRLIKDYSSLNFTYISVKNNVCKTICFSKNLKELYVNKTQSVLDAIAKFSEPVKKETSECSKCPYYKICV